MYGLSDQMFGDFEKKPTYKLKNGEHKFRLLPPWEANKLYAFIRLHWIGDEQGKYKIPVRCPAPKKKGAEELCPICYVAQKMKNQAADMMATNKAVEGKELEERAGSMSAKATYLWQILNNEGQHEMLSLSYRAHESLMQKVGFFWKQKQINVTDPERNYKMYCNRTGQKAQTNYAFEVLDGQNDIRKIDLPTLWDLSDHHKVKPIEDLKKIAELGFVPSNKKKEDAQPNPKQDAQPNPEQDAQSTSTTEKTTQQTTEPTTENKQAQAETTTPTNEAPATNQAGFGNFTADDIPF